MSLVLRESPYGIKETDTTRILISDDCLQFMLQMVVMLRHHLEQLTHVPARSTIAYSLMGILLAMILKEVLHTSLDVKLEIFEVRFGTTCFLEVLIGGNCLRIVEFE